MNIRELSKKRAEAVSDAQKVYDLAEAESRELTADEQAAFDAALNQADELAAKIEKQTADNERLRAAAASLKVQDTASEKPAPSAETKSMKRSEFDALAPEAKAAYIHGGGKLVD